MERTSYQPPLCTFSAEIPPALRKVGDSLISYIMKRKITFMNSGKRADGTEWFMLVFACQLIGTVIHKEETVFVDKDIYKAVKVGQEWTVK